MSLLDGSYHHVENEEIHQKQEDGHDQTKNVDGWAGEGFPNRKRGRDQCRVREHEREPGHRENHSTGPDRREMGESGDEKPEDGQAVGHIRSDRATRWPGHLPP